MDVKKIGIIGYGVVGQATSSLFTNRLDCVFYDTDKKLNSDTFENVVDQCNHIFICVNTKYIEDTRSGDIHDPSSLCDTLKKLIEMNYQGIVIIRTTIDYNTIMSVENIDKLKIVAMPEFLNQNNAFNDELNTKTVILGGQYNYVEDVINLLKRHSNISDACIEICSVKEALEVKIMRNIYGAYKVLFWNYVQEYTDNSRKVYQLMKKLPEQGDMNIVGLDGKLGYDGKCFPKDVLIARKSKPHLLTVFMYTYNCYLRHKYDCKLEHI